MTNEPYSIIGVDPGKKGALTFINPFDCTIQILDMPIRPLSKTSKREEVDIGIISDYIIDEDVQYGYIEDVWSMATDGHVGAFTFGEVFGSVRGAMVAMGVDTRRIRPGVWKATFKITADKGTSLGMAQKLMPCLEPVLKRKMDDGRAESALIALYGCFDLGLKFSKPLRLVNEEALIKK